MFEVNQVCPIVIPHFAITPLPGSTSPLGIGEKGARVIPEETLTFVSTDFRTYNVSLSAAPVVPPVTVKSNASRYAVINFFNDIKPATYEIFVTRAQEVTAVRHLYTISMGRH